jgi:hypothetical protein
MLSIIFVSEIWNLAEGTVLIEGHEATCSKILHLLFYDKLFIFHVFYGKCNVMPRWLLLNVFME